MPTPPSSCCAAEKGKKKNKQKTKEKKSAKSDSKKTSKKMVKQTSKDKPLVVDSPVTSQQGSRFAET